MKKLIYVTLFFVLTSCSNKLTLSEPAAELKKLPVRGEPNTLLSQEKQLTFNGSKAGEGYFSPDGKMMIFQSERFEGNPFYQMYLMNLETGKTQLLSPGFGKTTCGWIHPSMKKVLFSSTHLDPLWKKKTEEEIETRKKPVKGKYSWSFDDTFDIFSSDLRGKNLIRLTKEKGYDAEASYSPDGQWIAFASNRAGYTEKLSDEDQKIFSQDASYMMDIYIMKADGTQVKRLTSTIGYDGGPFFSADGKKITWRRFAPNGMTAEIYTMNVDGSDQRPVTHLKSMSWAPYFHPSGDYIVFTSSVYGYSNFELFIVDAEGKKEPVRVTFNEDFDGLPVFSPDGNKLSWTRRNAKGDSQIFIADWDDAQARKLLGLSAKEPRKENLKASVNSDDLKTWVYYLASEEFAGRKTGGVSESVYSEKIASLLKTWGFQGLGPNGSFMHRFEFTSGVSLGSQNELEAVGSFKRKYKLSEDFEPLSFSNNGLFREAPVVFAGYGIKAPASDKGPEYNSYKNLDVHGKWVLVFTDIPSDISSDRKHYLNTYSRLQHKVSVAKNEGAVGIIFTSGPVPGVKEKFGKIKFDGSLSESSIAVLKMSSVAVAELVKYAGKDLESIQAQLDKGEYVEGFVIPSTYIKSQVDLKFAKSTGVNIVAKLSIPGAKNAIMLGAHADHLGHGEMGNSLAKADEVGLTHYGADDNASGVAGVMELAHYLSDLYKNKKVLKKDIIVGIWSGEEVGVLGSSRWIQDFQKQNKDMSKYINAYLNMDMIGRYRNALYVQGVGSANHWHALSEEVVAKTGTPLVLQEDPYLPTDSMAFYLANMPAISFFTGSHPEYHSPRDKAELVNYEGEVKVLDVVKAYTLALADSQQMLLKYIKVGGNAQGKLEGRSFRVYLGTIPDYSQEGVKGVKISGVSKASPAEEAGLKEKDILIEFDNNKIENLYDYVYTLQSVKPNKQTTIKVLRDSKIVELRVTPKLKD